MELVRRGLLLAGALLVLGASGVAEAAPAALSGERSPADVRSTFGSGGFGRWSVDRFGLPAFRYLVDQQPFPPARQPELKGATEAQHQLGNDHIVGRRLQPRVHAAVEPGQAAPVGEPLGPGHGPLRRAASGT